MEEDENTHFLKGEGQALTTRSDEEIFDTHGRQVKAVLIEKMQKLFVKKKNKINPTLHD